MFRQQIASIVRHAIALAVADGKLLLDEKQLETIFASISEASVVVANSRHGADYSTGVCFQIASLTKLDPFELATILLGYLNAPQVVGVSCSFQAAISPHSSANERGFLNFSLSELALCECLKTICVEGADYGRGWANESKKRFSSNTDRPGSDCSSLSPRAQYKQLRLILQAWNLDNLEDEEFGDKSDSASLATQGAEMARVDLQRRRCLVFARALGRLMKFAGLEVEALFDGQASGARFSEFLPDVLAVKLNDMGESSQTGPFSPEATPKANIGAHSESTSLSSCAPSVRDLIIAPIEERLWAERINSKLEDSSINRMGATIVFTQNVSFSPDNKSDVPVDTNGSKLRLSLFRTGSEFFQEDIDFLLLRGEPNRQISIDYQNWSTIKANVIFHLRYAQARCCAILRLALEPSFNVETQQIELALMDADEWQHSIKEFQLSASVFLYGLSEDLAVHSAQKALILQLAAFPTEISQSVERLAPARLVIYASDLADKLDEFLGTARIITPDKAATQARLGMIYAIRQVLENVLGIMGITAPERM